MRIGYISNFAILGMQEKLLEEGHTLNVYFSEEDSLKDESGLTEKYPGQVINYNSDMEQLVQDSEFVYCDFAFPRHINRKVIRLCEKYNTYYTGANSDDYLKLEEDRHFAKKVAVKYLGLDPVETKVFKKAKDFIKYVNSIDFLVVVKAVKDSREAGTFPTYIPSSKEDLLSMANQDAFGMFAAGGVVTEPYHENCYEVCLGGFFNGYHFNDVAMICQEYKGAKEDNVGCILTGEVGTVSKFRLIEELPERVKTILRKLENFLCKYPFLKEGSNSKYRGYVDMNVMIDREGHIFLLEFTTRQGIPTELEALNMVKSYGDLLAWESGYDSSYDVSNYDLKNYYVSACLFAYGYPNDLPDSLATVNPTIKGLDKLENPYRLMFAKYNKDGQVAQWLYERSVVVHGKNKNFLKAKKQCLSELKKLNSWYSIYRTDIGHMWKDLEEVI